MEIDRNIVERSIIGFIALICLISSIMTYNYCVKVIKTDIDASKNCTLKSNTYKCLNLSVGIIMFSTSLLLLVSTNVHTKINNTKNFLFYIIMLLPIVLCVLYSLLSVEVGSLSNGKDCPASGGTKAMCTTIAVLCGLLFGAQLGFAFWKRRHELAPGTFAGGEHAGEGVPMGVAMKPEDEV